MPRGLPQEEGLDSPSALFPGSCRSKGRTGGTGHHLLGFIVQWHLELFLEVSEPGDFSGPPETQVSSPNPPLSSRCTEHGSEEKGVSEHVESPRPPPRQPARAPLLPSLCRDTEAVLCPSTEVALLGNRVVDIQFNNCSFCPYAEEAPLMPLVLVLRGLSEDGGGYSEVNKTFLLRDIGMDGTSPPPFSCRTPFRALEGPTQRSGLSPPAVASVSPPPTHTHTSLLLLQGGSSPGSPHLLASGLRPEGHCPGLANVQPRLLSGSAERLLP